MARPLRKFVYLGCLLLIPAALASCGDGGDDGDNGALTADDQGQIKELLIDTQTTSDPAHCTEDYTGNLVSKVGGLEQCRRIEREGGQADTLEFQSINGTHAKAATAHVVAHGGNVDKLPSTYPLAYDDGRWKVDDFTLGQTPSGGSIGATGI